ncbi:hypothetical protein Droror1_Dr00007672 [Drosera rotundifolia]
MNGETGAALDQGIQEESTRGDPNCTLLANSNVDSFVCVQTGEEFSTEFLRDRLAAKMNPSASPIAGNKEIGAGNHNDHNSQLGYEDLARILGLGTVNSESGSDVLDFLPAREFPSNINNFSKGHGFREGVEEVNFDQATFGSRIPPITAMHSPHCHYLYESGTNDESQSDKIRILCSFGGNILPRPNDGKLRYVGGETRIISIRKHVTWEELLRKTTGICNQAHSIKYQLPGEDLDVLISVSSDEDILNMMEEYNGTENQEGSQRLRIFLIPGGECESQCSIEANSIQQDSPDYQYLAALNGIFGPIPRRISHRQNISAELKMSGGTYDLNMSSNGHSPSYNPSRLSKEVRFAAVSSNQSFSNSLKLDQHGTTNHGQIQCFLLKDKPLKNNGESNGSCATATHEPFNDPFGRQNFQSSILHFRSPHTSTERIPLPRNHFDDIQVNGCFIPMPACGAMATNSEKYLPDHDGRGTNLASMVSNGSFHGMIHVFSDSQLQRYGQDFNCSHDILDPSSPLNFGKPFVSPQEKIMAMQGNCNSCNPDPEKKRSSFEVVYPSPLRPQPVRCYQDTESQKLGPSISKPSHFEYSPLQEQPEQQSCVFRYGQTSECHSRQDEVSRYFQYSNDVVNRRQVPPHIGNIAVGSSKQVNKDANPMKPLIDVEDVSNCTSIVYHVVDAHSGGSRLPGAVEIEGTSSGVEFHNTRTEVEDKDDPINNAVTSEKEAEIYGLQIIKNADLEEHRELGTGTYGTVYHGTWRGSAVAIKRIKNSCFSGRSSEQDLLTKDFWREAQILSKFHHPNVVAFYGIVLDGAGRTLATVTEYMVNGSLRNALIKKDRTLDRRKKLLIAMDAAFGMEYLHSKNVVHFDLKCDNLLVNLRDPQRPICKVGDFGLSRIKRNTLVSGGVRGTLPWIAPELLNGSNSKVSEKVDVFSFGIVMWEILTGEEPYANMHCGTIIGGILKDTLRPPIPSLCDSEWRKLMERCWSTDPDARPSFSEVADRLRSMSAALPSKGYPYQKPLC